MLAQVLARLGAFLHFGHFARRFGALGAAVESQLQAGATGGSQDDRGLLAGLEVFAVLFGQRRGAVGHAVSRGQFLVQSLRAIGGLHDDDGAV